MMTDKTHLIVHADSTDARAAAGVVVKHLTEQGVPRETIEIYETCDLLYQSIGFNLCDSWLIGLSLPFTEHGEHILLQGPRDYQRLALDADKLHILDCSPGTVQFYDLAKRPWFVHGVKYADDEFLNGRSLCVTAWLDLFGFSHEPGTTPEPIPQPLLYIEDEVLGYYRLPDSRAINLAIEITLRDALAYGAKEGIIIWLSRLIKNFSDDQKESYRQYGSACLTYRSHLTRKFGPTLEKMGVVLEACRRAFSDMSAGKELGELQNELPALLAELGIEKGANDEPTV